MATHRIPIINWASVPDASGFTFPEGFDVKATNDVWDRLVMILSASGTRNGFHGGFVVPKNYVGGATFGVVWTSTATANNCVWDLDYRTVGGDDTTSLDQAGNEEALTVTDAAPGAALRRLEATMAATAANFTADEEVEFFFARDSANASDTMTTAAAIVFTVFFEYVDA